MKALPLSRGFPVKMKPSSLMEGSFFINLITTSISKLGRSHRKHLYAIKVARACAAGGSQSIRGSRWIHVSHALAPAWVRPSWDLDKAQPW